jgi:hypothetical protein
MGTRVPLLGTAFVLLAALPVQADRPVPDHDAICLQVPTGLQQRHPSDMQVVGDLNAHAGTLPLIVQDQPPVAIPLLPEPWWTDELARRR